MFLLFIRAFGNVCMLIRRFTLSHRFTFTCIALHKHSYLRNCSAASSVFGGGGWSIYSGFSWDLSKHFDVILTLSVIWAPSLTTIVLVWFSAACWICGLEWSFYRNRCGCWYMRHMPCSLPSNITSYNKQYEWQHKTRHFFFSFFIARRASNAELKITHRRKQKKNCAYAKQIKRCWRTACANKEVNAGEPQTNGNWPKLWQ